MVRIVKKKSTNTIMTQQITLYNGDCIKKMKEIEDDSVDIIISDLPYGRFKQLDWDKCIDLKQMWVQIWRISKPTTPVFLFGDFKFANILINSQPKWFKYEIVWEKTQATNFFHMKKGFGIKTEYVLVFYKKLPTYNYLEYHTLEKKTVKRIPFNTNLLGTKTKLTQRNTYTPSLPCNMFKTKNINNKLIPNITEKPQPLLEHLLKYFSNENDICLDFCMGSGSMGVACKNLNRKFIGIELKKEHYDVCIKRLI